MSSYLVFTRKFPWIKAKIYVPPVDTAVTERCHSCGNWDFCERRKCMAIDKMDLCFYTKLFCVQCDKSFRCEQCSYRLSAIYIARDLERAMHCRDLKAFRAVKRYHNVI